ncbi:MAG: hypothetical protein ACREB5_08580 [Sphingomonadaceae bacterium]
MAITLNDIQYAAARIVDAVVKTPIMVSRTLSEIFWLRTLYEVRKSAVHRIVQRAWRTQQAALLDGRGTPQGRRGDISG